MYFIAEIGVNHEGSMDAAKEMISQIAAAGAHAAKFQTYKASSLAAKNSPAYWDLNKEKTKTQYELFKKYDAFEKDQYIELAEYCAEKKVDFISTPFDLDCLDWLIPIMPVIKIASADLTNYLLLEKVADSGKDLIISVGASTDNEIEQMLNFVSKFNVPKICLLHCMLLYPTPAQNAHLGRISDLKAKFEDSKIKIGYSDHVAPTEANNDQLIAAFSLGASTIEKHFTNDKNKIGNDHYHAVDHTDLSEVIKRLNKTEQLLGSGISQEDLVSLQSSAIKNARRSLFYKRDLAEGSIIAKNDLIAKRPGFGIGPQLYESFIGKKLVVKVSTDDQLDPKHFLDNYEVN